MVFFANHRSVVQAVLVAPLLVASSVASAQTWKINLRDADLNAFINEVADITGRNFAVDPRVRGTVTVISNKALSRSEVYDLFLGVLSVNGMTAIPSGNTIRIVPDANAKNVQVPYDENRKVRGDQIVTRVVWLENTNPNDLIPALRPLMPQYAHLAAVPGTNAIIISDRANNISELETIIRNLDGTGQNDIEAVVLQNSQAEEIIELLDAMSSTGSAKDVKGSRVRVMADSRTNRILIKGDPRSRVRIKRMIANLDLPSAERLGGMRVFSLKYADAKNLAQILQGLVSGQSPDVSLNNNNNSQSSLQTNSQSSSNLNTTGTSVDLTGTTRSSQNSQASNYSADGVSIIADENQNALVVKAEPSLMREIESAITQLDTRRKQVLIEAAIVEVTATNTDQLGIQWAMGDINNGGVGVINFSKIGTAITGLIGDILSGGNTLPAGAANIQGGGLLLGHSSSNSDGTRNFYGALIQALKQDGKTNLLSVPSILTMDNQEAQFVVGKNVPIITGTVSTGSGGTVNPYTTYERQDVGITLKVVPHIGADGTIRMELEQEVSSIDTTVANANDIITNKRMIKTSVLAENEQTIVLGGLMQDDILTSAESVPGLSKIPFIGRLFRSDGKNTEKRNLLLFLHPTIVEGRAAVQGQVNKRYQQLRELELSLDSDGSFSKLPENVAEVYRQRIPIQRYPAQIQNNSNSQNSKPVNLAPQSNQLEPRTSPLPVVKARSPQLKVTAVNNDSNPADQTPVAVSLINKLSKSSRNTQQQVTNQSNLTKIPIRQ